MRVLMNPPFGAQKPPLWHLSRASPGSPIVLRRSALWARKVMALGRNHSPPFLVNPSYENFRTTVCYPSIRPGCGFGLDVMAQRRVTGRVRPFQRAVVFASSPAPAGLLPDREQRGLRQRVAGRPGTYEGRVMILGSAPDQATFPVTCDSFERRCGTEPGWQYWTFASFAGGGFAQKHAANKWAKVHARGPPSSETPHCDAHGGAEFGRYRRAERGTSQVKRRNWGSHSFLFSSVYHFTPRFCQLVRIFATH